MYQVDPNMELAVPNDPKLSIEMFDIRPNSILRATSN